MFSYLDPTSTGFLEARGALDIYREIIHDAYRSGARVPDSAFTILEAFDTLPAGQDPETASVPWPAFPRTAGTTSQEIDDDRLRFQDEYAEWRVERDGDGITRVTFTTEFPEYFEALARVSVDSLKEEVANLIPGAVPTDAELFGDGPDPAGQAPLVRARRFRDHLRRNPWNNGDRGILCLTQGFNTLGALVNLLAHCSVPRRDLESGQVCAAVGGFCGPNRNSDPKISEAVQDQAIAGNAITAVDPVGVMIQRLDGEWRVGGDEIDDINEEGNNGGAWRVSRGGHRAVLENIPGLTLDTRAISTGAQVSTKLFVSASVLATAEANIPEFARAGNESRIV